MTTLDFWRSIYPETRDAAVAAASAPDRAGADAEPAEA
jgi:hypothetical protein